MISYYKQRRTMIADFKKRNQNRVAEDKVEEYLNKRNVNYLRYGLDHLDSELPIYKIPSLIRSAPDYIIFKNYDEKDNNPIFVEAKGFVNNVKLKLADMKNYAKWNAHMEIMFILYDVKEDAYCSVMYNTIVKIISDKKPEIKSYPENPNNRYYEIPTHWLPDFTNF